MKVRMWTKRAIPVVALVALVSQSAISYGAMGTKNQSKTTTSTTMDLAAISDSLVTDQSVIVDQGRGYGTAVLNAFDAGETRLTLGVTGVGCNNSSAGATGPIISFDGTLSSANVEAHIRAQTSAIAGRGAQMGEDYWSNSADLTVTLEMGSHVVKKQGVYDPTSSTTGVGGNPHIWVRFRNSNNDPGEWQYVGRCVQEERNTVDLLLNLPGRRHIRAATSSCTNGASDMSLRMRGGQRLRGDVAFTNQKPASGDPFDSVHSDGQSSFSAASLSIALKAGQVVENLTAYRWMGGNPNFGVNFMSSTGTPTPTIMLGRCKDMMGNLDSSDLDITVDQI